MTKVKVITTYAKPPVKTRPLTSVAATVVDRVYARTLREADFRLDDVKEPTKTTRVTTYNHADGRVAIVTADTAKGIETSLELRLPGKKKPLMDAEAHTALLAVTSSYTVNEPVEKVNTMLRDAAVTTPHPPKEPPNKPAAPVVSDIPIAAPTEPPTESRIHKALKKAQFKFVQAEAIAGTTVYGYQHRDRRAVLLTVTPTGAEVWTLRWPDGDECGGKSDDTLAGCLRISATKHVASKTRCVEQDVNEGIKTDQARTVVAAVKPGQLLPDGPADHVLRAIEMLGQLTNKRYDINLLRGDKYYGDRMALLRVLLNKERGEVKAAETGINNVQLAFYSAIGIATGSVAAKAAAFTLRCAELLAAWKAAKKTVKKAERRLTVKKRRDTILERTVPGKIIPMPKGVGKAAEQAAREAELKTLEAEVKTTLPEAKPDPEADLVGPVSINALRLVTYKNGSFGLRLERGNSQGALQLLDTDSRVSVSVLTPFFAKTARIEKIELDTVDGLLTTMEQDTVKRSPKAEAAITAVRRAIRIQRNPGQLESAALAAAEIRDSAAIITVCPTDIRLLEDPVLGPVLLQLEALNSQGAICVYNNSRRVAAVVVPPDVLQTLRPIRGIDVVKAASQLLTPSNPGVPVSPVAQRYLTAVIDCKEMIHMATASVAIAKKFEAPKGAAKKSVSTKPAAKKPTAAREGYAGKKIVVLKKKHEAHEGTIRAKALDLMLSLKTTDELIPRLKKIGANNSFIAFGVREGFIKLA